MPTPSFNDRTQVNGARLWDSLEQMAKIGATPAGGVTRLALTDEDRAGRDLLAEWAHASGYAVRVDRLGNMFIRREGRDPALAPVLLGSHGDSQPLGGRYDGIYGVLAGLEVLRSLDDHGVRSERAIEVVNWTNEEGSRFAPAMISSGVFAGVYEESHALSRTTADGQTLGAELERIGYAGAAPVGGFPIHAHFELHIEQGPILEAEGITIGVVTGGQGQRWYEGRLKGQSAHAGTTPMERRRDAGLGLARIIEGVHRIGLAHGRDARATVGHVRFKPNSRNVVPGEVFYTVEFRHPDEAVLGSLDRALFALQAEVAAELGLVPELAQIFSYAPIEFDAGCIAAVRGAAQALGYSQRDIVSGAGHDACYISRVAPTAMIFIPCIDGLSHNEAEDITPAWSQAGADVLLQVTQAYSG